MNNSLPIEVGLAKAKVEIIQAINQIGMKYELPSSFTTMLVEQIVSDTKLNTFGTIISNYDISIPKAAQLLQNDDVEKDISNEPIPTKSTKDSTKPVVKDDPKKVK